MALPEKSETAFKTISEVAAELKVPAYVLRFWEVRFEQINPTKLGGGRRHYSPEDVVLLSRIRDLLYNEGYSIKGVQKLIEEKGVDGLIGAKGEVLAIKREQQENSQELMKIFADLDELKTRLMNAAQ